MGPLRVIGANVALSTALALVLFGLQATGFPIFSAILPLGGSSLAEFAIIYSLPLGVTGVIYAIVEIVRLLRKPPKD